MNLLTPTMCQGTGDAEGTRQMLVCKSMRFMLCGGKRGWGRGRERDGKGQKSKQLILMVCLNQHRWFKC